MVNLEKAYQTGREAGKYGVEERQDDIVLSPEDWSTAADLYVFSFGFAKNGDDEYMRDESGFTLPAAVEKWNKGFEDGWKKALAGMIWKRYDGEYEGDDKPECIVPILPKAEEKDFESPSCGIFQRSSGHIGVWVSDHGEVFTKTCKTTAGAVIDADRCWQRLNGSFDEGGKWTASETAADLGLTAYKGDGL